ncbi:GH92 family glycosyl hydrolase [Agromyces sp. NPDC058136]|uniref:GH92 family glycosyl hydrolase n=1 Tax=Agromyces sp. NPDC058136 TaxID=3346354 RepID=UPI0036DC254E
MTSPTRMKHPTPSSRRYTASIALAGLVSMLLVPAGTAFAATSAEAPADGAGLVRYVDTLIGPTTSATMAGPTMPNGAIYPSPETTSPKNGGYTSGKPVVGFGQLYAQGTGGTQSYGNFLLSPQTGGVATAESAHASPVTGESGSADYYTATLTKYGITTEVTPAENAAFYRFTYPEGSDSSIVLDVSRKIGGSVALKSGGQVTIDEGGKLITGGGRYGGNWNPAQWDMYFAMRYDKAPREVGTWDANGTHAGTTTQTATNTRLGAYLKFDTQPNEAVNVKVAISFVSVEKAVQSLDAEIPEWDFDATRAGASDAWNSVLGDVELGGDVSDAQKTKFYTAMFHTNVQPRDRVADTGYWDDYYTLWDSWKTVFPFLSLTRPEVVGANVNSFIKRYEANGYLAETFTSGKEFLSGQGGNEAENVIADAYLKQVPGVDWEQAYAVAKGDSEALRTPQYVNDGYHWGGTTAQNGLQYASRIKPASATIGFAINDHGLSAMADGLGKTEEAEAFRERAQNWKNVWDPNLTGDGFAGFAHNRKQDGTFPTTTPTSGYNTDYYEASIWEGSYNAIFDVPGMVELMGGKDVFTSRLSNAFSKGYINYGNEPSFQTIWLFSTPEVGRPDLASKWVDQYVKRFPANGYPGDEDNGAMSSIYMFMMSGLFPFSGTNTYYLHGPKLPEVTYNLANGKEFVITGEHASAENIYVQSATLNGEPLNESSITYEQIMAGGELAFVMGPEPSDWARGSWTAPTDVANLAAAVDPAAGTVQLNWDASEHPAGIRAYRVHRGTTEDFTPSDANLISTATATSSTDKPGPGVFYYKVVALSMGEHLSAHAAAAYAVVGDGAVPAKYKGSLMAGASGRVNAQAAAAEGASAAFDMNTGTKWSARVTDSSQDMSEKDRYPLGTMWVETDLGAPSEVSRWLVQPDSVSPTSSFKLPEFLLQVKRDGTWEDVSHITGFQGPEHDQTLDAPVTGQVFRLLIPVQNTTSGNYNARIQEFHLFGEREAKTYPITVVGGEGVTVAADTTAAAFGQTVTVDVTGGAGGWTLQSLDVTHAYGSTPVTEVTDSVPPGVRRFTFQTEPLATTVTATTVADPPFDGTIAVADDGKVAAGRTLAISGTGFTPYASPTVELRGKKGAVVSLGSVVVDPDGTFSVAPTVPRDTAAGKWTLAVVQADGEATATAKVNKGR